MKWLNRLFNRKTPTPVPAEKLKISPEKAELLLQIIQDPQADMLSCDQVYELLDQYAERVNRGEDVVDLLPLVHSHLHVCPECQEEYEALTAMIKARIE
ncbi:MAG: hypothetical protein LWX83_11710 [Anaerolineae bacterium]|nr:hypothetical protein [Anaerolineae bacterium]